jgi:hypothetical protein
MARAAGWASGTRLARPAAARPAAYSTVTDLARFRGWSTSQPPSWSYCPQAFRDGSLSATSESYPEGPSPPQSVAVTRK